MVAIGDCGCSERERMVELAVSNGWIQEVAGWAVERGNTEPVVVLATEDCHIQPGTLGQIVQKAIDGIDAMPAKMRRTQEAAGCVPFVVFTLPLAVLCRLVSPGSADDLRGYAVEDTVVLCMNADITVLISGVSRTETEVGQ